MLRQIVGIEMGFNKTSGKPFTVLHTVCEFNDYETTNRGAEGKKCESTYIRGSVKCEIGDEVNFTYQPGWNNKAEVTGIEIVK
jgi:hypothetical protein